MEQAKKMLNMTFATAQGGTFKIALENTRDDLSPLEVKQAMDAIVEAGVFETSKGEVISKVKAYYVTQEVETLNID